MNGGRGEPSKTGGAKRPSCSAAQLNFVSSRHGGIYLSRQKVWSAKRPLTCAAQLNFVSSRHGEICLPRQKVWSAKRPLTCAAQLNFVSSRHEGISLPHGSDNSDRKALFSHSVFFGLLIINQPFGLFAVHGCREVGAFFSVHLFFAP